MKIKRALISVSDKTGVVSFAKRLHELGVEILSTGGTAGALAAEGIPVVEIADYTGEPEMFDGRLKTIHPKVHGGLLFRRDHPEDPNQAQKHGIPPIDLLVVNLYPFEQTVAREGVTLEEAIENIDIGGPGMLRAASKNYSAVTVISDPEDYEMIAAEIEENDGETSLKTREALAIKVFQRTAEYDAAISGYLNKCQRTESSYSVSLPLASELRYGENPHQEASLYGSFSEYFTKLQGKDLSYTNVIDISAAAELISEFKRPAVAILKHTNPCGVGCADEGEDLRDAWEKAFETDRQAPFGGVIVCNRPLSEGLARVIGGIFTDVIIAPGFDAEARAILQKKKNLRLMCVSDAFFSTAINEPVVRSAPGGLLVMDADSAALGLDSLEEKVKTSRPPSAEEMEAMRFTWRVCKHVKSNAIVFGSRDRTLGVGAGQMSRVDACRIAVWKAGEAGLSLKGSAVASDAMFPFPDGLISAAEAGATACIQPGGSVRDDEVIAAADERDVAMVFTGHRHFRH
ncbi:MAG: bifunctional phosphoribosylaminoimidazolecarboxamide formyltransferase/IMP cyclohydrolase [Verrucomicrobiales bacterium]|nr:bifunctional phosphoribosylaminoimidazolecarboxamide formyltransferase/IMP cyclohydrolase [Verrucomicrobiales bacterium]